MFQSMYDKSVTTKAPASEVARNLEYIKVSAQLHAADKALCEGVPNADIDEAWSYTLQAASAGSVAATAYFLMSPPTGTRDDSPILDAWAETRVPFLQSAIAAGNVHALYFGYFMSEMGFGAAGANRPFPKDPYQAVVYGTALLPLLTGSEADNFQAGIAKVESEITPSDVRRAEAEGNALRSQYFSSATPVSDIGSVNDPDSAGCSAPQ